MFFAAACGLSAPTPSQPQVVTVVVTAEPPPTATPAPNPTPLPSATVGPPAPTPTPSAPKLSNKPPDGPQSGNIGIEIVMDPNYLMQVQTRIKGSANNGDGIGKVTFLIERYGEFVYEESETLATYCIFKGGEPDCNPWPQTNGRYTWGAGGAEVETGDYKATIRVWSLADPNHSLKWTFDFTIDLP
jgi:hypothetical protein